jgi:plastocyanin
MDNNVDNNTNGNKKPIIIVLFLILAIGGFFLISNARKGSEELDVEPVIEAVEEETSIDNEIVEEDITMEEDSTVMGDSETVDENVAVEPEVRVFEIGGGAFYFTLEEIVVNEGDTVRIVFTNEGGTHDWIIDEFGARTPIIQTGQTSEIEFVADQVGSFEYYCSVAGHREQGMVGTLTVEPIQ